MEINRADVDRRLRRLQGTYPGVTVRQQSEVVDAATFERLVETAADGYVGAAYVRVRRDPDQTAALSDSMAPVDDEPPRVLVVLHRGSHEWTLPGGGRDASETFEEAAVREVREETAVDCEVTGLLRLLRTTTTAEGVDDRIHCLWPVFDARYVDGHIEIQPSELDGAAWVSEPPGPTAGVLQGREEWFPGTGRVAGDGGPANDGGTTNNGGAANDGGTANDGGAANDGGTANDGGAANDGGTANGGGTTNDGEVDADVNSPSTSTRPSDW